MTQKKSKYKSVKTEVDGIMFDSKAEARRYQQLKLLVRAGEIQDLEFQPRYEFIINDVKIGFYKADFRYTDNGKLVVEDVKGMKTPVYNLKKKLMKAIHNIDIFET